MNERIDEQLEENAGATFYGGKFGFDYVCYDGKEIQCSGSLNKMMEYSQKFNWAVAILIPVRFSEINK